MFIIIIPGPAEPGYASSCVCVEVLQPSQPNVVMLSTVSLPNHTFTGQFVCVELLRPSNPMGLNPQPPGLQSDSASN